MAPARSRHRSLRSPSARRFTVLVVFIALCALTGGSSQPAMPSQILLRPGMALGLGAMLLVGGRYDWRGLVPLAAMLACLAALIAAQLIPLPPHLWAALPGHARFAAIPVDDMKVWRPLSMAPDLTVISLLALLPPAVMLVGYAGLEERHRARLLWVLVAISAASSLFVLLQIAGGTDSAAFTYNQGDRGVPSGLLANRNHQALMLACTMPLLAVALHSRALPARVAWPAMVGGMLMCLPLILLTGSRTGTLLGVISAAASLFLMPPLLPRRTARFNAGAKWALASVAVVLLAVTLVAGRALSLERAFVSENVGSDMRVLAFPTIVQMTRDFLPWGIGFGAFDPVYRAYEVEALLHPRFFNHAHNDLLEFILTGGVAAGLLLIAFLAWFAWQAQQAFRNGRGGYAGGVRQAAVLIVALVLAASLPDYPLRTGIIGMVMTLACCWMATIGRYDADA